jgi:myo-inositol 2-dehydrogenase/D-chiro-inositol 1-dehydrogenase
LKRREVEQAIGLVVCQDHRREPMQETNSVSRRDFLAASAFSIIAPHLVRGSEANSAIRVGLLGCGGRGTADATSMVVNGGGRVVALADLFADQLERATQHFNQLAQERQYPAIDSKQIFRGPQAAEQIAASKEVDAIVIATPPYFHPQHLATVVEAGKHVYCEKPVAVDVAGAKRVQEIGRKAAGRLSLDVGFQIRSAPPFVELMRRIHAGALGEIYSGAAHCFCPFIDRPSFENATEQERRLRNWIYDRVLSGDIIVEQNIHAIDICNWALQAHPVKAFGAGGRKDRFDSGDCYGHYEVIYWYPDDVTVSFSSKQSGRGGFDVTERFFGARGSSESPYSGRLGITGDEEWTWQAPGAPAPASGQFSATGAFSDNLAQADAEKHKAFIESIATHKFHNQAEAGVESSLTAMLGRAAAYEKREYTWDELVKSNQSWDAKLDLSRLG